MDGLFAKLWKDDVAALIAAEYLFVGTLLVIGTVVGLTNLRNAIAAELSELGNSILTLSQAYTISGVTGCSTTIDGTMAIDTPGSLTGPTATPPSNPAIVNVPVN